MGQLSFFPLSQLWQWGKCVSLVSRWVAIYVKVGAWYSKWNGSIMYPNWRGGCTPKVWAWMRNKFSAAFLPFWNFFLKITFGHAVAFYNKDFTDVISNMRCVLRRLHSNVGPLFSPSVIRGQSLSLSSNGRSSSLSFEVQSFLTSMLV